MYTLFNNNTNSAGIILINSGGWGSPVDTFKVVDNGKYRFASNQEMTQSNTWAFALIKRRIYFMDVLDKQILKELQHNNRISSENLGMIIGLSATACQRRLKKVRQSNVIDKEIAVLNRIELNNYVTVIVEVTIKQGKTDNIDNFKKRMLDCEQVQPCFYITGQADFILIVTSKNMLEYEKLTKRLFFIDNNRQKFHSTVSI